MEKSPFFLENALKKSKLCLQHKDRKQLFDKDVASTTPREAKSLASSSRPRSFLQGNSAGLNLCASSTEEQQQSDSDSTATTVNGKSLPPDDPAGFLQYGKLTRRPMNTDVEATTKKKSKLIAVCVNCGGFSADLSVCDFCRRAIPSDAKQYLSESCGDPRLKNSAPIGKHKFYNKSMDGKNRSLVIRKSRGSGVSDPRKLSRVYRRRTTEPVCLTISSDEEGENSRNSEETCNDMNTMNVTSDSERKSVEYEALSVELKKEKQNILSTEQPPTPLTKHQIEQELSCKIDVYLKCRSIRVGSYKYITEHSVKISTEGITFITNPVNGAKDEVEVNIHPKDFIKILANFSSCMPVLFIFTTPGCAGVIRSRLRMSYKNGPCYDPGSSDESQKRITFVPLCITTDDQDALTRIFSCYGDGSLLNEIDQNTANEILLRSTPVKVRKMIRSLTTERVRKPLVDQKIETRSSTATVIRPTKPAVKLMTYPPPPQTGGITITSDDFSCLEEGEFLNDVIIDFYLKYLVHNILSESNKKRTHVFSSFFYRRLMQRPTSRHATPENPKLSAAEIRHSRVKTWTRHVDIFDKDFIIIPINESSHWFLAVICFPYLEAPVPFSDELPEASTADISETSTLDQDNSTLMEVDVNDDLQISQKNVSADLVDYVDEPNDNVIESEKEDEVNSTTTETTAEKGPIKQPCILIFDSLSGSGRNRIITTLREYLQVEWRVKKKTLRTFDKDHMKGSIPEVPQQTNYSDCGIYVLQYVESFFEEPILNYKLPIKQLKQWFSDQHVGKKRQHLQTLIQTLKQQQDKNNLVNGSSSTSSEEPTHEPETSTNS